MGYGGKIFYKQMVNEMSRSISTWTSEIHDLILHDIRSRDDWNNTMEYI